MGAKAIMVQGTMSGVGKSLLAAGLCRIFRDEGYRTAPFKSQNMALNCYITADGLEMGRAQAVQAAAAGQEPSVLMNPVLLKPNSDSGSQVIVLGKPLGNMEAEEYFRFRGSLMPMIRDAYARLADENDIIVIEGAGSPAEINLKRDDIVNMGIAEMADAPVLLAGDIDRGGVFAQLYGTVALLEPGERERIAGLIINKFRGDISLLGEGPAMLERLTGKPVLGIVPYMDVRIEDEDSLSEFLGSGIRTAAAGDTAAVDLAVIRLPRISNYTDFQAFYTERDVRLRFVEDPAELGNPDAVILPGTKSTIRDLLWMRERGLEAAVLRSVERGSFLFGICGGYQMMGLRISDPGHVETGDEVRGMGVLAEETVFSQEKKRIRFDGLTDFAIPELSGLHVTGYEVHMGRTYKVAGAGTSGTPGRENPPVSAGGASGVRGTALLPAGTAAGTYLHGIFDEAGFRGAFLNYILARRGRSRGQGSPLSAAEYQERQFGILAATLKKSLEMERIRELLRLA